MIFRHETKVTLILKPKFYMNHIFIYGNASYNASNLIIQVQISYPIHEKDRISHGEKPQGSAREQDN